MNGFWILAALVGGEDRLFEAAHSPLQLRSGTSVRKWSAGAGLPVGAASRADPFLDPPPVSRGGPQGRRSEGAETKEQGNEGSPARRIRRRALEEPDRFQVRRRKADRTLMTQAWDAPPPSREVVEAWLDQVRPALVADGGNVELLAVDRDGTVRISLQGACADCPAQLATLRLGIEEPMRKAFEGILSVVAVDA